MSNRRLLEEKCSRESFVCPQWLPGGKSFWFRRERDQRSYEFVLVEIVSKSMRPAFDHGRLAEELRDVSGDRETTITPDKLPFTWIEIGDGCVRFRFNQQIWQYADDKGLSQWEGEFSQANLALAYRPRLPRNVPNGRNTSVTFVNQSGKRIGLYNLKNETRKAHFFAGLESNSSMTQKTNAGQLWRFTEEATGLLMGHYCVPDLTHDTVFVGDLDFREYWGESEALLWEPTAEDGDIPEGWEEYEDSRGRKWYYHHSSDTSRWTRPSADSVQHEQVKTPSGEPRVIILGNVFLLDETGAKFQLTTTASANLTFDKSQVYLSPNKRYAVVWQYIGRNHSNTAYTVDYMPADQLYPKLIQDDYSAAGSRIKVFRPLFFNLGTKCEVETSQSLFSNPYEMDDMGWSRDGSEYRFIFKERGFQCIRVLAFTCDGQVKVLFEEKSSTFVDHMKLYYRILKDDSRMIWASERDGHNHLYLVDLKQSRVEKQITKGNWNVKTVEALDEENGKLWVSAYGFWENEDPYHLHLVSVNLDGSDCRALTKGDGTHTWSSSPRFNERDYFVDSWSRVDLAPQTVVRSRETGEVELIMDFASTEDLKKQGWEPPERFVAPGRDGKTPIYGIITRPPNFDEKLQYPVLELIYSGPQDFYTPKRFGGVGAWGAGGYVVVQLDGMGTNWRSKSFHDVCYKNLKDGGLPDRISWMKEAARTRPWMDLTRVGVMGGSAGGYNALSALLHYGDFYKVAVSDSGSHDHSIGDISWSEQWLGYPVDESYTDNSNVTHLAKLRKDSKLMLVAGGLDLVVNPASTMRVVTSLNKLRNDFDFLFIPEGGHNCGMNGIGYPRVKRFLKEHLGSGRKPTIDKESDTLKGVQVWEVA